MEEEAPFPRQIGLGRERGRGPTLAHSGDVVHYTETCADCGTIGWQNNNAGW